MTFADLQGDFFATGLGDWDDGGAKLARAKRLINDAYLGICNDQPWPFLETSATGAAPLTISDVRQVRSVRDQTAKTRLTYRPVETLDAEVSDLSQAGDPCFWYWASATQIATYPVKANDLLVRYVKRPEAMSGNDDVPVIPSDWHGLIVVGARIRAARFHDNADADALAALRQEFEHELGQMRDAELFREFEADGSLSC